MCSEQVNRESAVFVGSKQPLKNKKKLKCFGCKKEGHKLSECPTKKAAKSEEKSREKYSSKAHLAEAGPNGGVCFVAAGGENKKKKKKFFEDRRVDWYIDSGCSDHIVNDRSLFETLNPLKCPVEIAVAKHNESIVAKHAGTIKVVANVNGTEVECTVKDVLFVPESRCNLFSVIKVDEAGMRVTYENGRVVINRGSEVVAMGSRCGKLYRLDFYTDKRSASDSLLTCGRIPKKLELWHRRFGHLNPRSLEKLLSGGMVTGLDLNSVKMDKTVVVCEPCVAGKQTRKPFPERTEKRSSRVLELIHSDVCGPVTPVGVGGVHYFVTFIDDWSHFTMTFLMESKGEVFDLFRQYEAIVTAKFGVRISRLRCDNGGEYRSHKFDEFCRQKGIQVEWTVPHTAEQNGVSERMNRTLVERTRSMLEDSGVDKRLWAPAIQTATYLINRSPSRAIEDNVTPFELWEGKKPNVSKLRAFGCTAFVHVPKELRKKIDPKSWKGILVGYANNGYRIWNPKSKRIVHARDVDFVEEENGQVDTMPKQSSSVTILPPAGAEDAADDDEEEPVGEVGGGSDDVGEASGGSNVIGEASGGSAEGSDEAVSEESDEKFHSFIEGASEASEEAAGPVEDSEPGRPRRETCPPAWHKDYEVEYAAYALSAVTYVQDVPKSLVEAQKRDDWRSWKQAVDVEMDSLLKNQTWKLVELPANRTPITSKWVFKLKRGVNGESDRHKARLVARGFSQRYGFDYCETYSPVAKLDTLRTVLALANRDRMTIHQMDVKTAFLNGQLKEEIYMAQPEGFEDETNRVCRLQRSIYGLKQASKSWNDRFHGFMVGRLRFKSSPNDPCLYTRKIGNETVIVVLYVDDVIVAGTSLKAVELVKRFLSS